MDVLDVINQHKTVRKYTSANIEESLLNDLLEASCRASTTGNMQVYSIVVTRDQKIKEKLSPCHFNQPMVKQAPVVLTFCADFNRFNQWCKLRNAEPGYDNFLSFVTASIDALLAAQNFCVAAESKGLGVCYLGTTTYMASKIIDVLKLPKGVVPITTITVGHPEEDTAQVERLPLKGVVHYDTYKDYNTETLEEIYKEKEALEENQKFAEENDKETLAQVFTDVRYKKDDNITFSNMLLEVLKEQGFMNQ